jgi:uncharacterized protein YjbJ (UPF0337 family)
MDKDRIAGSAQEIKGKVKEVAGKVLGDAKLQSDGKADQAAGKVQNAVGGVKDTLKENNRKGGVLVAGNPMLRTVAGTYLARVRATCQGE